MNNIICTYATICRNVKDYKFTHKLEEQHAQEILSKVEQVLGADFHKLELTSTDVNVIKSLKNNNLLSKNSKILFVNKANTLSVSMFEEEHIIIRSAGVDRNVINLATDFATKLANKLNFAYSDDYGFLMSNLNYIGTGLTIACDLDLISILELGKIEQIKQNVKKLGFLLKEKEASIFTLSTVCNLGFSEKEIVEEFEKLTENLLKLELESAKMLYASRHDEIMDRTMRTVAILSSAYLLNSEELKRSLSVLRTGKNLGIIELSDETMKKLQQIAVNSVASFTSQSELIALAENVRNILKGEQNV